MPPLVAELFDPPWFWEWPPPLEGLLDEPPPFELGVPLLPPPLFPPDGGVMAVVGGADGTGWVGSAGVAQAPGTSPTTWPGSDGRAPHAASTVTVMIEPSDSLTRKVRCSADAGRAKETTATVARATTTRT